VQALELTYQKDREGYLLMRRMTRPRRARKNEDRNQVHWVDSPEQRERLHRYCMHDVQVERALFYRLPPLSPAEQQLWALDAVVNERGFCVDLALAQAARDVARKEQAAIDAEITRHTDGEITSVHQVARILAFVRQHGHALATLTKSSVAAVLAHEPGDDVRRLLELRQGGARASVRKLDRLLASVGNDARMRGSLRFQPPRQSRSANT
jgi:DNA polymerase